MSRAPFRVDLHAHYVGRDLIEAATAAPARYGVRIELDGAGGIFGRANGVGFGGKESGRRVHLAWDFWTRIDSTNAVMVRVCDDREKGR